MDRPVAALAATEDEAARIVTADDPLWYKDAVIYQLHIKAFFDANNDGIGDLAGLMEKLDYVQELGVNTVWLLPFYPSPLRDDGYDIADYRSVNPSFGTLRDVRTFVKAAHERGLRRLWVGTDSFQPIEHALKRSAGYRPYLGSLDRARERFEHLYVQAIARRHNARADRVAPQGVAHLR